MKIRNLLFLVGVLVMLAACSSRTYQRRGDILYSSGRFNLAGKKYQKAYKKMRKGQDKGLLAFKIGDCFDQVNNPQKAASWYRRALRSRDTFSDAVFCLAKAELKRENIEEAEENFIEYQDLKPEQEKGGEGLNSLKRIRQWMQNPARYSVSLAKEFNSSASDFSPVFMGSDTNVVLFASTRKKRKRGRIDPVTGYGYSNIYEVHYSNEAKKKSEKRRGKKRKSSKSKSSIYRWSSPRKLGDTINTHFNEGAICFTPQGDVMLFTSSKKLGSKSFGSKIYAVTHGEDGWGDVILLDLVADSLSCGHPAFTPNGEELYFVSDMPGGFGGNDIWKVKREDEGWSNPINLGEDINTSGDELFPFVREDGVLYFSSDMHPGMGGLDIFRAKQNESGQWVVDNMKYPLNSTADDFGIVFQPGKARGMFASSRKRGGDDIYRFEYIPVLYSYKGEVKDADSKSPMAQAAIEILSSAGFKQKLMTDDKGRFSILLEENAKYVIMASKEGYLNEKDQISTKDIEKGHEFSGDIELKAIDTPIELPNIFYDFASWELRRESRIALEGLVATLNDNPNITIELGAHTDMVGESDYNRKLSKNRAQAVMNYLVENGINWDRLVVKGYGESNPRLVTKVLADKYPFLPEGEVLSESFVVNLTPEQQRIVNQMNRRTEFRVLTTDYKPGPDSGRKHQVEIPDINKKVRNDKGGVPKEVRDVDQIKGVFYTVQVGIFGSAELPRFFDQFNVVLRDEVGAGTYKYAVGIFDSYTDAKAKAVELHGKGIDAFVVVYNNGKKISFKEAKKIKK